MLVALQGTGQELVIVPNYASDRTVHLHTLHGLYLNLSYENEMDLEQIRKVFFQKVSSGFNVFSHQTASHV